MQCKHKYPSTIRSSEQDFFIVDAFYSQPMLIEENWAQAKPLDEMLYDNHWGRLPEP